MKNKSGKKREAVITAIVAVIFAVFLINLFRIQIFQAEGLKNSAVTSVTVKVDATREEIFDCNGTPLVTNKQVNTIVFHFQTFPPGKDAEGRNTVIERLISLFSRYNLEWKDNLPIEVTASGQLAFSKDKEAEIEYLKSSAFLNLNYYADVNDCFNALVERYSLQGYNKKQARDIASVYYSMRKDGFNTGTPYVFATDVSNEVVAVIKENSSTYIGVDVQVKSEREYIDGSVAPHIIGYVGPISPEEYEKKKEEGYSLNDVIGKSGIEYTMEEYLRGEPGEKTIYVDENGNTSEVYTKQPVAGDNIILTIDSKLQKTAYNALSSLIEKMYETNKDAKAGAVVVMNTKNNDVLACVNYPSFDLSTYNDDVKKLTADPDKPLWNRALRSIYTPGSTIKPAVAMAGLEEGVINAQSTVWCSGKYTHYKDYQPQCTGVHHSLDVVRALYHSCNIFFYETSRLLGIDKLNDYYTMFGLGQKTGIELTENEGTVDSPQLRTSKGELCTPGLTIQAGIGHGDNQFTPIQLCSYVSTIANRGVRYKAHVIKSIMNSDYSQTVSQRETQVLSKADFKKANWNLVYKGMLLVGTESYADFSKVPETVAAKTGTTSIFKKVNGKEVEINNGLIMTFAPYDDPEIAVAVVIEGAKSGGSTAPVASAVMQQYFEKTNFEETLRNEGTLLQ